MSAGLARPGVGPREALVGDRIITKTWPFAHFRCPSRVDVSRDLVQFKSRAASLNPQFMAPYKFTKVDPLTIRLASLRPMLCVLALASPAGLLSYAQNPKLCFQTFNSRNGLSQDVVLSALQDRDGFLWVGTQSGLNRFDGYQFLSYRYDPSQPGSISGDEILSLHQDRQGRLWVGTQTAGLNLYLPSQDRFLAYTHAQENPDSLSFNAIQEIIEDEAGMLWIPTWGGGLNHFDPNTGKATHFRHDQRNENSLTHDIIWDMAPASDGTYWIATDQGLDHFNPKTGAFTHYRHDPSNPNSLSSPRTVAVWPDRDGSVWIGTQELGVNRLDPKTGVIERFPFGLEHPGALQNGSVNAIYRDRAGRLWVGTDAGLSKFQPETQTFINYLGSSTDPQAIPAGANVWRFYEDRQANLWLCSNQGLVRCQPNNERFGYFQRSDANGYLTSETYFSMATKDNRYLWTCGPSGLVRFDRETHRFEQWLANPKDPSDPANYLTFLAFDPQGRLWLTNLKRLLRFDESNQRFITVITEQTDMNEFAFGDNGIMWIGTREGLLGFNPITGMKQRFFHDPKDLGSLAHDAVIAVFVDSKQRIWAGTYGAGLDLLEGGKDQFRHFRQEKGIRTSLANNAITRIAEAPDGTIWVGTRSGLSRWNQDGSFRSYWQQDGLPNTFINDLQWDQKGYLWISTDAGLARMDTRKETFVRYDENDGLMGNIFNGGAAAMFPDGSLVFGGNGFNLFQPDQIPQPPPTAKVILTELLLFNERARLKEVDPSSPLVNPLHHIQRLELSYKTYVFAFRFAALDYSFSDRRTYEYKLDGLDQDWLPASPESRLASYTSLPGGTYTLHVRGRDKRGNLYEESTLRLVIHPAPWKTSWAYALYILVGLSLLYAYTRMQRRKLEKERLMVQRLNEVDRLKDAFLANTSHELRTPLHGMIGLAEAVLDHHGAHLDETGRTNIEMIVASGLRLSNLVNDILDFSKLQHNSLQCNPQPVDLWGAVNVVLGLTRPLLGSKSLQLINEVPRELPPAMADENRLQQIFFNLVGNAVKFTEQGQVRVSARVHGTLLRIAVTDTGIGIKQEKCEEIFHAFQQADSSTAREYGGTGLGLAVTRKLVELQGGKIWVESKVGQGSTFFFTLPMADSLATNVLDQLYEERQVVKVGKYVPVDYIDTLPNQINAHGARFRILVVDDDPVNRMVLVNHLSHDYQVIAVESGQAAIEAVEDFKGFDLILLDIMMPKMTGFDVCKHLRTIFPAHELPVIFLTAKMHANDVVAGFETGANDYIVKPVSKGELMMRVETHLQLLDANRNLEAKVRDRTKHLVEAQKELLREAHIAGMAEIAIDIMHNVGNRLNSLGTSVQLIQELADKDRKGLALLERFTEAVVAHADNLQEFLSTDPRVPKLPEYLPRITKRMIATHEGLDAECTKLTAHIRAMVDILQAQQKHSGMTGLVTDERINDLLGAVLHLGSLSIELNSGKVETHFGDHLPTVRVNRVRVMRVLMCLLQNAIEAIHRLGDKGLIKITSRLEGNAIIITIEDNGEGITPENMVKIFAYGFSTREDSQGFGLHYCANTVREMGADICIQSDGTDQGTCVKLTFPLT